MGQGEAGLCLQRWPNELHDIFKSHILVDMKPNECGQMTWWQTSRKIHDDHQFRHRGSPLWGSSGYSSSSCLTHSSEIKSNWSECAFDCAIYRTLPLKNWVFFIISTRGWWTLLETVFVWDPLHDCSQCRVLGEGLGLVWLSTVHTPL